MQWTFINGDLYVRCMTCFDLFGMDHAGGDREGREAVMPDGRPVRSIDEIIAKCDPPTVME
jgi:hypothetical protein